MALCIHFVGTNFSQGQHCDLYEKSLYLLTLFLVKPSIIITCLGLHLRDYSLLFFIGKFGLAPVLKLSVVDCLVPEENL